MVFLRLVSWSRRAEPRAIEREGWRKRKGIEPSDPSLARGSIGFEDRGRHQSGTRFHR